MNIREKAKALNDYAVSIRRELHSHPELQFDLPFTESVVVRELEKLGLDEVKKGLARGHGVIATLKGKKPGRVLAVRADMDGLPIQEATGLPFASTNGCMHACGHDAHTAMLLTAAKLLASARDELAGTVRFIFQPNEEAIGGARAIIEDGALENPKVDAVIGFHTGNLWPGVKPGQVGWKVGPFMASTTSIRVELKGRGGHGATPQLTVDPIVMAAEFISQAQTLVSREVSPFEPVVVTFGHIQGGRAHNVIADSCVIEGMMRSFSGEADKFIKKRLRETAEGVAATMRGGAEVTFDSYVPAVINDRDLTLKMRDILTREIGPDAAGEVTLPSSGAEDFAEYLQEVPGAFFYHCSTFEDRENFPHHNARFDVNESVLWTGAAAASAFALHWQD